MLDTDWDWSSLPAVFIGTAIPAAAGFVFANRLSGKNTKFLRKAQLEADDDHRSAQAAQEFDERESRRERWDEILDAVRPLMDDVAVPNEVGLELMETATQIFREELSGRISEDGLRSSTEVQLTMGGDIDDLVAYFRTRLIFPLRVRSGLPRLLTAVSEQVVHGHLYELAIVRAALAGLIEILAGDEHWAPDDATLALEHFRRVGPMASELNDAIGTYDRALSLLRIIADRERSAYTDASFDPWVDRLFEGSIRLNMVQEFARAHDRLDHLDSSGV